LVISRNDRGTKLRRIIGDFRTRLKDHAISWRLLTCTVPVVRRFLVAEG